MREATEETREKKEKSGEFNGREGGRKEKKNLYLRVRQ